MNGVNETYQNRKLRDARAKELKDLGYTVHKSSVRNQLLHPMYVTDAGFHGDRCLGNCEYKTPFAVLYILTADRS